jgi:putative transposase
VENEAL